MRMQTIQTKKRSGKMNNEEVITKYKQFLTNTGQSKNTIKNYTSTINQLLQHTKKPYDQINKDDIENWKTAYLQGKFTNKTNEKKRAQTTGLSMRGLSRQVSALRNFYEQYLELYGIVRKTKIKIPKTNVLKKVYTKEQLKKIKQKMPLEKYAPILISYYILGCLFL